MSTFAADDFDAIRRRMAELKCDAPAEDEPYCDACENGGWVQVYSHHPPAFGVCQDCFNPLDLPSP